MDAQIRSTGCSDSPMSTNDSQYDKIRANKHTKQKNELLKLNVKENKTQELKRRHKTRNVLQTDITEVM